MKDNTLVEIKVDRVKDEIVYSLDCTNNLTNEELEYYLEEIIKSICEWNHGVCNSHMQNHTGGTIKQK